MKKELLLFDVVLLVLILSSCFRLRKENETKTSVDIVSILNDSLNLFENQTTCFIDGEIQNDSVKIKYYSISKDEFLRELSRNSNNVRYFDKDNKINEYNADIVRDKNILKIGQQNNSIFFYDTKQNRNYRSVAYFLESKIGDFYIVKKLNFEDRITLFWNCKREKNDLLLNGISVSVSLKDSLVFYSDNIRISPSDSNPIYLFEINNNSIDTLFWKETNWWVDFSFFDCEKSSLYYIHSFYTKDSQLKSTFAKMDIVRLNQ